MKKCRCFSQKIPVAQCQKNKKVTILMIDIKTHICYSLKYNKNLKESEVIIIMSANRTEIVNEYSMMTSVYAF